MQGAYPVRRPWQGSRFRNREQNRGSTMKVRRPWQNAQVRNRPCEAAALSRSVPMAKHLVPKPISALSEINCVRYPWQNIWFRNQWLSKRSMIWAYSFKDRWESARLPASATRCRHFRRSFRVSTGVTSLPDGGSWSSKAARPLLLHVQISRKRTGITRKEYPDYTINPQIQGGHAMSQITVPPWHRSLTWGYRLVFRSRILYALRFHAAASIR